MRKPLAALVSIVAFYVAIAPGSARADVDVHVNLGVPPPPVITYEREPEVVLVPRTRVYYSSAPDYDLFRYGDAWYVNRDGYWYRSHSYRGPFAYVRYDAVPRAIVYAPAEYHHYPVRPHHWDGDHHHEGKHGNKHGRGHHKH
jgi:hypothetical protein